MERRSDLIECLSTDALIRAWRQDFGIDVARLFEGIEAIELRRDAVTAQIVFHPPVMGDAAFYQGLRKFKWYHPKRKLEHLHAAQNVPKGATVLDIGAGPGDFAEYLSHAVYQGLESDPNAVDTAGKLGRNVHNMDMASWRRRDAFKPAAVVTAFQVLEHVADPSDFVKEMVACCAGDGQIIIGVPDAESYVVDLPDFVLNAPPHHVSWWTEEALRRLMGSARLELVSVTRFPVEPWEYQLWWMAKIARALSRSDPMKFGRALGWRKVLSFILSWPLQWVRPPQHARGATLLIETRRKL